MRIKKSTVLHLSSCGYLTLQVPEIVISFGGKDDQKGYVEYPDDYFCCLKGDNSPQYIRTWGFLYLTSKGFEHFKDDIKEAFTKGTRARGSWDDFLNHVSKHFASVEDKRNKLVIKTTALVDAYKQTGETKKLKLAQKRLEFYKNFVV